MKRWVTAVLMASFFLSGVAKAEDSRVMESDRVYSFLWAKAMLFTSVMVVDSMDTLEGCESLAFGARHLSEAVSDEVRSSGNVARGADAFGTLKPYYEAGAAGKISWSSTANRKEASRLLIDLYRSVPKLHEECITAHAQEGATANGGAKTQKLLREVELANQKSVRLAELLRQAKFEPARDVRVAGSVSKPATEIIHSEDEDATSASQAR